MRPSRVTGRVATGHRHCDFDALASVVALTMLFPDTTAVIPRSANPNVRRFLSMHKDLLRVVEPADVDWSAVTHLLVADTNRWNRLDPVIYERIAPEVPVSLWDHHPDIGDIATGDGIQEPVGATITLLLREIRARSMILTPIQATLFLAGLYEDTGNLTFNSTTAEDARAAAYLLERKADLDIVRRLLRPAYGLRQKEALFKLLSAAERFKIDDFNVGLGRIEVSGHLENLALVVRMFLEIMNVDAAFGIFFQPERDRCMVIARSTVEEIDVGTIMQRLGGGGHPGAGSSLLKAVNPEAVTEMLTELLQGNRRSSVRVSDLMSFPVVSVTSRTPMEEVALVLRRRGCTGLPVIDGNTLCGVISRRDFKRVGQEAQLKAPVKAFMREQVHTIAPDRSPGEAVALMVKHDIGRLPVVADGAVIGIITRSDAMLYFYDLLPD
ncbi:MAG: CBS domain-containing protein [Desulfobacterales bacterium]|nr:CBS domain-containing protein [Desulfobacterales bacterium]